MIARQLKSSFLKIPNHFLSIVANKRRQLLPPKCHSELGLTTYSRNQIVILHRIYRTISCISIEEEIKVYLGEPDSSEDVEPIVYWKDQQNRFPCLSRRAKTHFSVPATSTPAERCFSGGRLICHHTRGSISSEKFSAPMCLNSWLKNGYQVQIMENDD